MSVRLLLLASVLLGCTDRPERMSDCGLCDMDHMYDVDYGVDIDTSSPEGIPVDTSGGQYDLGLLDTMAHDVEECLIRNFPDLRVPQDVRVGAYCQVDDFSGPYRSAWEFGCWQVKVDPDWSISCTGDQVLSQGPAMRHGEKCGGKDLVPTEECPCRYRVAITGRTIVVTPDMHLFKDGLVRAVTGCGNPWGHSLLSECAAP